MKTCFSIIAALLFSILLQAQSKEVSLVVTGEGATKEEATNNALRSAVEQAFGVFVSANTEILNDEIVKDEIATISSGNVKSFTEINYFENTNGKKQISLQVIVSVGKLIEYSRSHGSSAEFAGESLGANIRLFEQNKPSSEKAIELFYKSLKSLLSTLFDYRLVIGEPFRENGQLRIPAKVRIVATDRLLEASNYFYNSLESISFPIDNLMPLIHVVENYYAYKIGRDIRFFYSPIDPSLINKLFWSAVLGFEITDNNGKMYTLNNPLITLSPTNKRYFGYAGDPRRIRGSAPLELGELGVLGISELSNYWDGDVQVCGEVKSSIDYKYERFIFDITGDLIIDQTGLSNISEFSITPNYEVGLRQFVYPYYSR